MSTDSWLQASLWGHAIRFNFRKCLSLVSLSSRECEISVRPTDDCGVSGQYSLLLCFLDKDWCEYKVKHLFWTGHFLLLQTVQRLERKGKICFLIYRSWRLTTLRPQQRKEERLLLMIRLLRKYNLGVWKNVWCTYCNLPLPRYSSCSRHIIIKQLEKWTVNVRIWCVIMTCRSNFLKVQINHTFPAEKHIQPAEDQGVWLVIFPEHHPKVHNWGQLFSVVPGGCAFQQLP